MCRAHTQISDHMKLAIFRWGLRSNINRHLQRHCIVGPSVCTVPKVVHVSCLLSRDAFWGRFRPGRGGTGSSVIPEAPLSLHPPAGKACARQRCFYSGGRALSLVPEITHAEGPTKSTNKILRSHPPRPGGQPDETFSARTEIPAGRPGGGGGVGAAGVRGAAAARSEF